VRRAREKYTVEVQFDDACILEGIACRDLRDDKAGRIAGRLFYER
jgi:hypothetical protein